ncbi:CGNR zinc finger domain-containing protein [Amycolatopsis sp. QT-25]|uniref:CGNR zinc finger domain-containing protein n=1 Tax=Amycolatopsis sp. QT-25 TaxID=3034022 RepID=UPI0023EBB462|nr:ABATE domain-containing protein [Amycolatopsis sp. QT-25]WET77371.1 CGNR zinc finger domain-containing protein [Amycolatopsis sp. QT-25]
MFTFLSGSLSLDLTTTLQVRHRDEPRELLVSPADVTQWLDQAGLSGGITVDADGLHRTIALRELVDRLCRGAGSDEDRVALNATAAAPPLVPQWTGSVLRFHGDLTHALSTLARDALLLLAGPQAARIRECDHSDCSRLFLDASRSGRRRWCGMSACGTKVKSADYRRRKAGKL